MIDLGFCWTATCSCGAVTIQATKPKLCQLCGEPLEAQQELFEAAE